MSLRRLPLFADLDFSITDAPLADAITAIGQALGSPGGSVESLRLTDESPPRISFVGPLGRERSIKLDLADDEIVFHTERRGLLPRWPDLPEGRTVLVYTLLEIAGEKLRCVLQRLQCRDLYDLNLLFEEGVDAAEAVEVFKLKARHRGLEPDSFALQYRERSRQYRKRWEAELSEHVPGGVPHFDDVARRVARRLRQTGLM